MDTPTMIIEGIELAEFAIGALATHGVISEALPFFKKIKANNTSQLIFNILKTVIGLFGSKNKDNSA